MMACKGIVRLLTRKRYLDRVLRSGFEGAQSLDLGGYDVVEAVGSRDTRRMEDSRAGW